jgi:quercetin dioxygenase-like cupin family protein
MDYNLDSVPQFEILPGYHSRMIHTASMTTAFLEVKAGAVAPEHYHMHEQITIVTKGEFELTIDGRPQIYRPGMIAVIPSNVKHAGRAITDCELMDIFTPVREDFVEKFVV